MQPSRPLHRRVFDYYRREGFGALMSRIGQELMQRMPVLERNQHRLPSSVSDALPPAIFGNVDLPADGAAESSVLLRVAGWAWSRHGVGSIDIYIDGELVSTTTTCIQRHDVAAAFGGEQAAELSGYSADIPIGGLKDGPHRLAITARSEPDLTRSFERTFRRVSSQALYHAYYENSVMPADAIAELLRDAASMGPLPAFSLVIDGEWDGDLRATIRSIESQGLPNVSWRILASASRHEWIDAQLRDHGNAPTSVTTRFDDALVTHEQGSFIGFLKPGEQLAPGALVSFAAAAVRACDVIYSDHDVVQHTGRHIDPSFKPDWSPDHLLGRDYVGPSYMFRNTAASRESVQRVLPGRGAGWRYDLLLRLTGPLRDVEHIARVLWSVPQSHMPSKRSQDEVQAVQETIRRRAYDATVEETVRPGVRRIRWHTAKRQKVSIIIPTTGRIDYLRPCLDSLRSLTFYPNYEIVLIDNGRGKHREGIEYARSLDVRVMTRDEPFNWAKLNNDGARESDGSLLLFLNDDTEVVEEDWLTELVSLAERPDVGAVGAMLLYPNGTIQHAGVVLVGHGGGAMHLFHGLDPAKPLYLDFHAVCREVSATTGACLMVRRELFEAVGGFDEGLSVVGNDVDLCLRLHARGNRTLWTPHSTLVHHESVSRAAISIGIDEKRMWDRWADVLSRGDCYFNPNLDCTRPDAGIDWSSLKVRRASPKHGNGSGINLIGYIRAEMGLGEAARGYAGALSEADVPFAVIDYSADNPARMGDDSWLHKVSPEAPYDTNLILVNANLIPAAVSALPQEFTAGRYTIGSWAWEMPEFPDEWLEAFTVVNEVWAPSSFVRDAVSRKSPVPVIHIPYAVRSPTGPFLERDELSMPSGGYQFLTMYDVHSVRERKNPDAAVRAFKSAFAPDDKRVVLIIKVNGRLGPTTDPTEEWTAGYDNIVVMDQPMSRHEVDSLMARIDCFVSLHRSEGFGLPIAEAMSHGKPVIATYWSGNVDFMAPHNSACIDYEMVTLDRDYGPYRTGQQWAEPDADQASRWMKRLAAEPGLGRTLGREARISVHSMLAPNAIGAAMARRLAALSHNQ
jgi:GT2 family glycosyltransferase